MQGLVFDLDTGKAGDAADPHQSVISDYANHEITGEPSLHIFRAKLRFILRCKPELALLEPEALHAQVLKGIRVRLGEAPGRRRQRRFRIQRLSIFT